MKHRSPAEMLVILKTLLQPGMSFSSEAVVFAVVKTPVPVSGASYGGAEGEMGGYMEYGGEMMGYRPPAQQPRGLVDNIKLTIDQYTNTLIARTDAESMEALAEWVAAFDTSYDDPPPEVDPGVSVISFRHRTVQDMIRVLQELDVEVRPINVGSGEAYEAGYAPPLPPPGGTLLAVGDESVIEDIRKLIESLDVNTSEPRYKTTSEPIPSLPGPSPDKAANELRPVDPTPTSNR